MKTTNVASWVARTYMQHLVRTPEGRAHLFTLNADNEASLEVHIFDALKKHTGDAELKRLVHRHSDDEVRHTKVLRRLAKDTLSAPPPLPEALQMRGALDVALGGMLSRPIQNREDVMRMYTLLQVAEERAVAQFEDGVQALAPVDVRAASAFTDLAADEARHIKYCQAVARRYAPSPDVHARYLTHMRAVESHAFAVTANANLRYVVEHGLFGVSFPKRAAWRAFSNLTRLIQVPVPNRSAEALA